MRLKEEKIDIKKPHSGGALIYPEKEKYILTSIFYDMWVTWKQIFLKAERSLKEEDFRKETNTITSPT